MTIVHPLHPHPSTDLRRQDAALPGRLAEGGDIEVLLISSRETRRWVLPKGWPMKGRAPHQAAETEAEEEAGVIGKITREPVGSYGYLKRLNPALQDSDRVASSVGRLKYAQPICPPGFLDMLPPTHGVVRGLQIADTSTYYPEDRGISEGVRIAAEMAARVS